MKGVRVCNRDRRGVSGRRPDFRQLRGMTDVNCWLAVGKQDSKLSLTVHGVAQYGYRAHLPDAQNTDGELRHILKADEHAISGAHPLAEEPHRETAAQVIELSIRTRCLKELN